MVLLGEVSSRQKCIGVVILLTKYVGQTLNLPKFVRPHESCSLNSVEGVS